MKKFICVAKAIVRTIVRTFMSEASKKEVDQLLDKGLVFKNNSLIIKSLNKWADVEDTHLIMTALRNDIELFKLLLEYGTFDINKTMASTAIQVNKVFYNILLEYTL